MSEDKKHTKLPWRKVMQPTTGTIFIEKDMGDKKDFDTGSLRAIRTSVACIQSNHNEEDATLIVKAVNNHYRLLEALKLARTMLYSYREECSDMDSLATNDDLVMDVYWDGDDENNLLGIDVTIEAIANAEADNG